MMLARISPTLLLLLFSLIPSLLPAQVATGLLYDTDGEPLNGYLDFHTYSPKVKLSAIKYSDSYELGHYYDSIGTKISGLIKFEGDKILFKSQEGEFRNKLLPSEVKSFVLGLDSFVVFENFYLKGKLNSKPNFAHYITTVNGCTFVKNYHFGSSLGNSTPISETYHVKNENQDFWLSFETGGDLQKSAPEYFRNLPYLLQSIQRKSYQIDNPMSLIKMTEYEEKFRTNTPIYFDRYWNEICHEKAIYHAKITNMADQVWNLNYFHGDTLIYTANYSGFYPHTKSGLFTSYFPNGSIRQIIDYNRNKPQEIKNFNPDGVPLLQYTYKRQNVKNTDEELQKRIYTNLNAQNGHKTSGEINLLKVRDSVQNCDYFYEFNGNQQAAAYRIQGGDTIFMRVESNSSFKLDALQAEMANYMRVEKFSKAIAENAQGFLLMHCNISKAGVAVSGTILNSIHPQVDEMAMFFLKQHLADGAFPFHFKKLKVNGKKQEYEIVIPLEFHSVKFYRPPSNYHYFNHMYININQQQMMNSVLQNATRNIPGRF